MATNRFNIGTKFQNADIPSESDFKEIFDSFVHKDEDKADFQMVETGTDTEHYVTPALLRTGLQNIGIITGNSFMPHKENFEDSFSGTILPLTYFPIPKSVKVFKNGQLLQEGPDYTVNYDTAQIKFLETVTDRNLEVDYWYKNLSPNPGSGSGTAIDFTSFLHTSGNETKNGLLTFNNTTATSTSGIILKNSGAAATSLDVTNSGAGSGISLQNSSTGSGVKVSNAGAGVAVQINSETASTGDILQVSKNNVVKTKIDSEGSITALKFVTSGGTSSKFVKGDGSLDTTVYAEDTKVIHTTGNESKDGALNLTHNSSVQDVLTITKNNSANCLKLVQNSSSNATTSTFDTTTADNNRKAISIQKIQVEKAFITHDGNVSGTSFTTLNEKADITDGFLTLASSTSPSATAGHAKLYAKTNGTTDMYVMGSDGVEKKIGGVVDLSGKENTIALGTTAQYYRGDKSWQTLDKSAVGLTNVDNTSDLNKPISTATQAALNLKANLLSPSLTGTPIAPTAAVGTNTTQLATTAFVNANSMNLTTSQSFTGIKSATNTGTGFSNGFSVTNNGTSGTSYGYYLNNNAGGTGFKTDNNGSGWGAVLTNAGTGGGMYITNTYSATNDALQVDNQSSSSGSKGISLMNSSTGTGLYVLNSSTGAAISLTNTSSGKGIIINTSTAGTGQNFVGQHNGATTFTVDKYGAINALSFIKTGGTSSQFLKADGSIDSNIYINSVSPALTGIPTAPTAAVGTNTNQIATTAFVTAATVAEPTQITITTSVSITTDTLDANSKKQLGKNVIINNGASAINITVNGGTDFCASYLKHGAGAITFVQASGRTLIQVNATAILNGVAGSTATISSIGTTDYLRISNI
jgi:hypothetical protein